MDTQARAKENACVDPCSGYNRPEVEMTTIYMTTYRRQNYHGPKDRDLYKKPVSHGPAPVVPYSNAPAVRVQNLKRLQSVCGTEELATKLGVSLGRLELMLSGVNFSDEMAYHSEQSLGLTPGFLDRPGAVLTEAEKDFLLKPFVEEPPEEQVVVKLARPEAEARAPAQTTAPDPSKAATVSEAVSAQDAEQAKSGAPPDSQTPLYDASPALSYQSPDTLSKETSMSADPQLAPQESPETQLRKVRQENLKLLAEPKGVKSRMVLLTGLSPANLSHRLHGHKIFDAETGDFFCEKLGLPQGWFEAPRTAADIPMEVSQRLNGTIPGLIPAPALKQPRSTSKTAMTKPAGAPLAKTKAQKAAKAGEQPTAGPALSLSAAALGLTAAEAAAAAAPVAPASAAAVPVVAKRVRVAQKPAAPASAPSGAPLMAQSTNTAVLERPLQAPVQQQQAAVAPVNVGTPAAAALPLASADAGPLAQACLAVLTVKIQAGRLSEQKAMELLGVFANL